MRFPFSKAQPDDEWVVLLRLYLARRDPSFLREGAFSDASEPEASFLRAFRDGNDPSAEKLGKELQTLLEKSGRHTAASVVALARADLRAKLAVFYRRFPSEQWHQALKWGIDGCNRAIELAQQLEDLPCLAHYHAQKSQGLSKLGDAGAATAECRAAIEVLRELFHHEPDFYAPDLAGNLNNLGLMLLEQKEYINARGLLEDALSLRRDLAEKNPTRFEADLAGSYLNVGIVFRQLNELGMARQMYEEGLRLFERLAKREPTRHSSHVALALAALGEVLRDIGEWTTAKRMLEQSIEIYRMLAIQDASAYGSELAGTLVTSSSMLIEQQDFERARRACEEALLIYRPLAHQLPHLFESELARTLENLGIANRELHRNTDALNAAEQAVALYRQLAAKRPGVYQADLARSVMNLGNLRSSLGESESAAHAFDEARTIYEQECRWLDAAHVLYNMGALEAQERRETSATKYFERSVELTERGLSHMKDARHWDAFKRRIEPGYLWLADEYALRASDGDLDCVTKLVGVLESLRRVETLAGFGSASMVPSQSWRQPFDELMHGAGDLSNLLTTRRCTVLWTQATGKGLIFVLLAPKDCTVMTAGRDALDKLLQLQSQMSSAFEEISRAAAEGKTKSDATIEAAAETITKLGSEAFALMPERLRAIFTDESLDTIFLIPCMLTVNLPFESLCTSHPSSILDFGVRANFLGLRHVLPRLNGFTELRSVVTRQPKGEVAVVVGNPLHQTAELRLPSLPRARATAIRVSEELRGVGFRLSPSDKALLDEKATAGTIVNALRAPSIRLWVQMGHGIRSHGGGNSLGYSVACAGSSVLTPESVADLNWESAPIIHLDCCVVGVSLVRGGGRFTGHPIAALRSGASCVIASAHPLWDDAAADFSLAFYKKALKTTIDVGSCVLAARRVIAQSHGSNPLIWGTLVLWGNPWVVLANTAADVSQTNSFE
jgi:hypothetical protein